MAGDRVNENHMKVTAALICAESRIFIAQRPPAKKFALQWEFPGGKVEPGEGLRDSLAREIEEELSWQVHVGDLFHHLRHSYADFSIELYAYWCTVKHGGLFLREHVAFHWASIAELRQFDFTSADVEVVCRLEQLKQLP